MYAVTVSRLDGAALQHAYGVELIAARQRLRSTKKCGQLSLLSQKRGTARRRCLFNTSCGALCHGYAIFRRSMNAQNFVVSTFQLASGEWLEATMNEPKATSEWDEPKLNQPEDDDLLGEPPLAKIRRGWVIGIATGAALLLAGSMVYAMSRKAAPRSERELQPRSFGTATARVPESIRQLELATKPAAPADEEMPPDVVNAKPAIRYGEGPEQPLPANEEPMDYGAGTEPPSRYAAAPSGPRARVDRDESSDEAGLPWVVPAKGTSMATITPPSVPSYQPGVVHSGLSGGASQQLAEALARASAASAPGQDDDDRKEAFASRGGIETLDSQEDDLAECDLSAGRPVHGNVLVAVNSDIPAKNTVTIKVSQTVYCGADREHVAIPQGSTFVGSVDSRVVYGQERLQLCMHQLERPPSAGHPTGSRKQLGCMVVASITGETGMIADVDNHWGQLISGVALSTLMSLGASGSMGNQQGFAPTLAQNAAHAAGNNINQAGQRIVQRDVQRKPTLKTEQLEGVVVIFSSNLELEPWLPRARRSVR